MIGVTESVVMVHDSTSMRSTLDGVSSCRGAPLMLYLYPSHGVSLVRYTKWPTFARARRLRHSSPGTVSLAVAENDDDARLKSGRNYHNAEFLVTTGALLLLRKGAGKTDK